MRILLVVAVDVPAPEDIPAVLEAMGLPGRVPHFSGEIRVVPEPHATELIDWLDA